VGTWTFGDPIPTYLDGELFQTDDDHTPGPDSVCALTGNFTDGVDDADVDDGATRLVSPVYDLSSMTQPHVFYYRWHATEQPQDAWEVEVSSNGGATWILIESATADERFWQGVDVDLGPVLSSFGSVRFRFLAQDHPPEQILEAALDDFTLYDAALTGTGAEDLVSRSSLSLRPGAPNPFRSRRPRRSASPCRPPGGRSSGCTTCAGPSSRPSRIASSRRGATPSSGTAGPTTAGPRRPESTSWSSATGTSGDRRRSCGVARRHPLGPSP
jgi:hypothetical protein